MPEWVEGRVRESADGLKRREREQDPLERLREAAEAAKAETAREKWKQVAEDWDTDG